jgi:hypothetical protein
VGSWDGAFVSENRWFNNVMAVFQDKKDYVGKANLMVASWYYYQYIDQGWIPMSIEDINTTAGGDNLCSPPYRCSVYLAGIGVAVAVGTFLLYKPNFFQMVSKMQYPAHAVGRSLPLQLV